MKEITKNTFGQMLNDYFISNTISWRKAASAIGCSERTLKRITEGNTLPTDEMLKQGGALMAIGFSRYRKLSRSEKERISECIGTIGGSTLGFAMISSTIGSLGYAGLSAAGVTSGLATLGGLAGGGMAIGITLAAAIPIAGGAIGYGAIKAYKHAWLRYLVGRKQIDPLWEEIPSAPTMP